MFKFCQNFLLKTARSDFFCASFRSGFCFSMKSWNVARCTIRVSSFCEILFVFLQQILDFQFIQNNTHLASGFPVIFCQMVLWFQIRIIFFSCCPILNMSCSDGHLRFPIHTKIDIFLVNHHMVIHVQFRFN
jgi:hypothetical protein